MNDTNRLQLLQSAILENVSYGIISTTPDGTVTSFNPAAERMLGYTADEIVGKQTPAYWHDSEEIVRRAMQLSEELGETVTAGFEVFAARPRRRLPEEGEWTFIRKDGERIPVNLSVTALWDESDHITGFVGLTYDLSERKRAEAALAASEQQFRSLAENSPDNVVRYDRRCRARYYNPRMVQTLGVDPLTVLGKTPVELGAGGLKSDAEYEGHIRRVLESGVSSDMELTLQHPGGGISNHLIRFAAERDAKGDITGVQAIGRDITERKRVEDALLFVAQRGWQISGENFFDALAQFLGEKLEMDYVLIDRIDENPDMAETVALYAKGAITPNIRYALKGTPCENVMGRRLCVYPQGIQQLFPEDTLLPAMGVESYIGIPLWDSTGRPIGLIAVMGNKPIPDDTPVTQLLQLVATRAAAELERERSDRLLRAREHEFRTLAANLPDNIVRYDLEGRAVYVNPVLEKTLGVDAARILGTRIRDRDPSGSYGAYAQAVDAALASGKDGEIEITVPIPGKEPIVHQISIVAERDEQGQVSGVLAIGRDITERKQAEAERLANLHFFESMDRVNRAIQGAHDLDQMMGDVLDVVLAIFDCDRAFLFYPCDPEAPSWRIPMERTKPEYPGALSLGLEIPMDAGVARTLRELLASDRPVKFGPQMEHPLVENVAQQFGFRSFMSMAIYPKTNKPWQFGIQQCAYARVWTAAEEKLIQEIGRRLSDGLSSLLSHRELEVSERKYHTLFEESQDALYIAMPDGKLIDANRKCIELFGYDSKKELASISLERDIYTNPSDRQKVLSMVDAQGSSECELVLKKRNGELMTTLCMVSAERDRDGAVRSYRGIVRDITAQRKAEEQIRIAATAFEAQEGIIITDADMVILCVNNAFTEITGYAAEDAIGQTPRLLRSGRQDAVFYARMWEDIRDVGFWQGEIWNRRKNGEIYPEWLNITAVKNQLGEITHYVGTLTDITARKAAEERIEQLAFYDPLTALPNRRLLLDRLQQVASSGRGERAGALLLIDLDNFKALNDTRGHGEGDLLLQQVAKRLVTCVREGDTVARLGGDEFVVVLAGLSQNPVEAAEQTGAIAKKILATLSEPYRLADYEFRCSSSIGATLFLGSQQAKEELLKQADISMYEAKKAEGNALRFFDHKMQETVNARAVLEKELRVAIEKHQFQLYYQVQVLSSRHPFGCRSALALDAPGAWTGFPGTIHTTGGRDRLDPAHRAMGAGNGLCTDQSLAK